MSQFIFPLLPVSATCPSLTPACPTRAALCRNTSAEIRCHPAVLNKAHHDTYLRQGELRASSADCADVYASFEAAVQQLEHKLKAWSKAAPRKMDPKHSSQLRQHGSTARGNV